MTSASSSFPRRLTKIDELTLGDHSYLASEDRCYFLGEYTARKGFSHSATNNLIINLKKPIDRRRTAQWQWKERAIRDAANALNYAFGSAALTGITFVPIPPSKRRADPLYDDRMPRVLKAIRPGLDVRELVLQSESRPAAHESDQRLRPDVVAAGYVIDETIAEPQPVKIAVCDDVLTTGCQYRAMRIVLSSRFPLADIFGVFIARRAPEAIDSDPVELGD